VVAFGVDVLKLARLGAVHLASNPASGRVMQKLGMHYEGTQRQFLFHRGRQADVVHYGRLATDA
jgi:RimJ/RimL family protein N-acetyltransferase